MARLLSVIHPQSGECKDTQLSTADAEFIVAFQPDKEDKAILPDLPRCLTKHNRAAVNLCKGNREVILAMVKRYPHYLERQAWFKLIQIGSDVLSTLNSLPENLSRQLQAYLKLMDYIKTKRPIERSVYDELVAITGFFPELIGLETDDFKLKIVLINARLKLLEDVVHTAADEAKEIKNPLKGHYKQP